MNKRDASKPKKLPKRVAAILALCRSGQKLCKHIHHRDDNATEIIYFFEPSGRTAGPFAVKKAIELGVIRPCSDGLFSDETAQTFEVAI